MPRIRPSASALKRNHRALCFDRAFPKTRAAHEQARAELCATDKLVAALPSFERARLCDTGIAGTTVHYPFSFEVAQWLAKESPGAVSVDWPLIGDTSNLDLLLVHLLQPAEDEYFDSGYVSSREWIDMVRAGASGTDFDWLMTQLGDKRSRSFWSQLYNAAEIPLVWRLGDSRFSKSRNAFPAGRIQCRGDGMRKRPRMTRQEIQRPLDSVSKLSSRKGAKLIDVALASLAVRHRETWHFNHANPREVYLADVGHGVAIAVFGLLPEFRFPLECTMGYLILSNGVPIGYGGSSVVFRQVNTGINLFDEYRASEASYLWVQVMRVYHALIGCTRYIANPYQFGGENSEALRSGAFWFYYRLGYRPVLPKIRKLAQREASRIRRDTQFRSDVKTLRKLSSCDMHLKLPDARANELFEERWIETSSMLATTALGTSASNRRRDAANDVAAMVANDIGLRSLHRWSATERRAFKNIAPIIAATKPRGWAANDKRTLRELLHAKGGAAELRYARLLCQHDKLLISLRNACRRAETE